MDILNITLDKQDYKPGDTIHGSIILRNDRIENIPNLFYKIFLGGDHDKNGNAGTIYDVKSSNPLFLRGYEIKTVDLAYTLPDGISGNHLGILVGAFLEKEIPLGWSQTFFNVSGIFSYITATEQKLLTDDKEFYTEEGPPLYQGKQMQFQATLSNPTSQQITIIPKIDIYKRVATPPTIKSYTENQIILGPHEKKVMLFQLPNFDYQPGVYVGIITLTNPQGKQNGSIITFRYLILGDTITIDSVTSPQTSIKKGEKLALNIRYSGPLTDIIALKRQKLGSATLQVRVTNEQDRLVASDESIIDANIQGNKFLLLEAKESGTTLRVETRIRKGDKVLGEYTVNLSPSLPQKQEKNNIALPISSGLFFFLFHYRVAIGISFIILMALLILVLKKRKSTSMLMFALMFLGVSLIPHSTAYAWYHNRQPTIQNLITTCSSYYSRNDVNCINRKAEIVNFCTKAIQYGGAIPTFNWLDPNSWTNYQNYQTYGQYATACQTYLDIVFPPRPLTVEFTANPSSGPFGLSNTTLGWHIENERSYSNLPSQPPQAWIDPLTKNPSNYPGNNYCGDFGYGYTCININPYAYTLTTQDPDDRYGNLPNVPLSGDSTSFTLTCKNGKGSSVSKSATISLGGLFTYTTAQSIYLNPYFNPRAAIYTSVSLIANNMQGIAKAGDTVYLYVNTTGYGCTNVFSTASYTISPDWPNAQQNQQYSIGGHQNLNYNMPVTFAVKIPETASPGIHTINLSTNYFLGGYWTFKVVNPVPTIGSFTATPTIVAPGGTPKSSTLSWTSTKATSCSISPSVGTVGVNGTVSVSPAQDTTYTLTCSNTAGSSTPLASINKGSFYSCL